MIKNVIIILWCVIISPFPIFGADNCYLVVEKSGDYNPTSISDYAIPLISRYIETVISPGYEGVGSRDCQYKISLSENIEGISIALGGRNAASFGDSKRSGMKGVKQALLRAIYRAAPHQKSEICDLYSSVIPEDCGISPQKKEIPSPPKVPVYTPRKQVPFNTDYEVLAVRFFEAGDKAPKSSERVYKTRFSKSYSRYIYTEFKINNLQYKLKEHQHDMVWFYYNSDGSLRGRINGTFNVNPKWATAWIYRGWGWSSYGNWPRGTYTVKIIMDGVNVATETFTIY